MMSPFWVLWLVFMLMFLVAPIGYGSGFRRWGMPYPRYIQNRRARQAGMTTGTAAFDHRAWGLGGDLVWLVVFVAAVWAFSAFVFMR